MANKVEYTCMSSNRSWTPERAKSGWWKPCTDAEMNLLGGNSRPMTAWEVG